MKIHDKLISVLIMGLPIPVLSLIAFWWTAALLIKDNDRAVMVAAATGLVTGLVILIVFVRRKLFLLFAQKNIVLFVLCAFYMMLLYGALMGFPVLIWLAGPIFSYIIIRRDINLGKTKEIIQKNFRLLQYMVSALISFACVCTAIMALLSENITYELQSMLNPGFQVTMPLVWVMILAGSALLILVQIIASYAVYRFTYGRST